MKFFLIIAVIIYNYHFTMDIPMEDMEDSTVLTILSNMQMLRNAKNHFHTHPLCQKVIFKSDEEFFNYIRRIDQREQEIVFSFEHSPVKMYIPKDEAVPIYSGVEIYSLTSVSEEKFYEELLKIMIFE